MNSNFITSGPDLNTHLRDIMRNKQIQCFFTCTAKMLISSLIRIFSLPILLVLSSTDHTLAYFFLFHFNYMYRISLFDHSHVTINTM